MSDLVTLTRSTFEIPQNYLEVPKPKDNRPIYATTSSLLRESYRYLIEQNPPRQGRRLEKLVIIAGKVYGSVRSLEMICYPKLNEQSPVNVRVDNDDLNKHIIELDRRGLSMYGWIHNHPGKGYIAASPSEPIDVDEHHLFEQAYNPFLSVIVTEDGTMTFWQPREFEIFVDGRQIPLTIGPRLREHMKVIKLKM